MKIKRKAAITLIVLVITILVLSILATTVIVTLSGTDIIDEAEMVAFKSDMVSYNDIYVTYVVKKTLKDISFDESSLNLTYKDAEYTNIFGKVPDKYKEGLKIIKGKLVYITKDEKENEIIQDMDMLPNKMKITNRLAHCTTSNTATAVAYEKSYTSTLTADSGYTLQEVTVVMGGTDITSTVYNSSNKTITINKVTDNVIITATTDANTYTVTNSLTQVINSNSDTTAKTGTNYSATLTAKSGYTLKTVKVTMNGTDITSTAYNASTKTITINSVTGNIIITASATANVYTVTNSLTNVTTNNTKTNVTHGSKYTAVLTPSTDYEIKSVTVKVNGVDITNSAYNSSTNTITINSVTGNIVITANASEKIKEYTITNNLSNATSTNASTKVTSGSSYTATLVASSGYAIQTVTVLMGNTDITSTAYNASTKTITINSVTDNVTITVTTKIATTYTITYHNFGGVTFSNTATSITEGSTYTTTITCDKNMAIWGDITVNGINVTSEVCEKVNNYTWIVTIADVAGDIRLSIGADAI